MPNSFADLNTFGNTLITFEDERPATVIFNTLTPNNATVFMLEQGTSIIPHQFEILQVTRYDDADAYMVVDVSSNADNITVNWPVTSTMTVTEDSGVYTIGPIKGSTDWSYARNCQIIDNNHWYGSFDYTVSVEWLENGTTPSDNTYTVTCNVVATPILSTPTEFVYANVGTNTVSGQPVVNDTGLTGATYTLTITPSLTSAVTTLSTSGTGGTVSFNNTSKILTISGNITQVNSHLSTLVYTSPDAQQDFVLTYYITNTVSAEVETQQQHIVNANDEYLGPVRSAMYYDEGITTVITGGPLITDSGHDGTGTYTMEVSSVPPNLMSSLSSVGSGGTSSYNVGQHKLTITGTRAQVNSHIDAITMITAEDVAQDFYMTYKVTVPGGGIGSRAQQFFIRASDTEIINMDVTRSYKKNINNLIFATTVPEITDVADPATVYTITLSSNIGTFGITDADYASTWTYSGTKSQCNALFPTINFWPNRNTESSGTITFQLIKNSIVIATQTALINWNGTTEPFPSSVLYESWMGAFPVYSEGTQTSVPYTPNRYRATYLLCDILLVGAGGYSIKLTTHKAGGGGGQVKELLDQTIQPGTYALKYGPSLVAGQSTGAEAAIFNHWSLGGWNNAGYYYPPDAEYDLYYSCSGGNYNPPGLSTTPGYTGYVGGGGSWAEAGGGNGTLTELAYGGEGTLVQRDYRAGSTTISSGSRVGEGGPAMLNNWTPFNSDSGTNYWPNYKAGGTVVGRGGRARVSDSQFDSAGPALVSIRWHS